MDFVLALQLTGSPKDRKPLQKHVLDILQRVPSQTEWIATEAADEGKGQEAKGESKSSRME